MKQEKRIVCYKYGGKWCEGDGNDFSKPLIDESLNSNKCRKLRAVLSGCKNREVMRTHKQSKSNLRIIDLLMLYPKDGKCPITGIPFSLNNSKGMRDDSPSIDRLVPSRGYKRGNIRIISWLANRMKGDKTKAEFFINKAQHQYEIYLGLARYLNREIRPDFEI